MVYLVQTSDLKMLSEPASDVPLKWRRVLLFSDEPLASALGDISALAGGSPLND